MQENVISKTSDKIEKGVLIIYTDGSYRPKTNSAGVGIVLEIRKKKSSKIFMELSIRIEDNTASAVEYMAIIRALIFVKDDFYKNYIKIMCEENVAINQIIINTDCQTIVTQIQLSEKQKHKNRHRSRRRNRHRKKNKNIENLLNTIKGLKFYIEYQYAVYVDFKWIPRKNNSKAHRLSQEASKCDSAIK